MNISFTFPHSWRNLVPFSLRNNSANKRQWLDHIVWSIPMAYYDRNVFTVPLIYVRHTGQFLSLGAQSWQLTRCPQGKKTVLISMSIQTLHVLASVSRRFSTSSCCSSSAHQKFSTVVTNAITNLVQQSTCIHDDVTVVTDVFRAQFISRKQLSISKELQETSRSFLSSVSSAH